MDRVVGTQDRSEFETRADVAWRRGRMLDRALSAAQPPRARGVLRANHRELNRLDAERALEAARRLNRVP